MSATSTVARTRASWVVDTVVLLVTWIAMIAIAHPWGDFPVNDDWVYAAAARSVLNGHFEVYSFSSANVGVLAYWGALFARVLGDSADALRISTLCLGFVGIVALYALMRSIWGDRTIALVAALATIVNPIYFSLACTFMTDVPFVALVVLSMLAVMRGIERDDDRLVVAGLAVALVTTTMRQFAVVVFAGYALAHVVRRGVRWRTIVVALLPLAIGLLLNEAFTRWLTWSGRKPYPGGIASLVPPSIAWGNVKWSLLTSLSGVGLLVVPVALLCMPTSRRMRWRIGAIAVVASVLGIAFVTRGLVVPIGDNVLHWYGVGPLTNGDTLMENENMPEPSRATTVAWTIVTALTVLASASVLAAATIAVVRQAVRRRRLGIAAGTPADARAVFVFGVALSYVAFLTLIAATGLTVFDRYLLPLALVATIVLPGLVTRGGSPRVSRPHVVVAAAALVVAGTFTVVATHDFFAWSRTRWAALQALVASGVSPHRIDGGYEFNGSTLHDPLYKPRASKNWWWVDDDEYLTSSGPMPGYTSAQVYPVDRWWKGGGRDVFILHR